MLRRAAPDRSRPNLQLVRLSSLPSLAAMTAIRLKAHFDGRHIVPDEPTDLPINTPLTVTVSSPSVSSPADPERIADLELASAALARAYAADEPTYTFADLKPRS